MIQHHLVIDFETMSNVSRRAAVVDLAAFVFNFEKMVSNDPYTLDDIDSVRHWKLDVIDQVKNYDYEINDDTVAFWQRQDPEVRARVRPKPTDLKLIEFSKSFHEYLIESPKIYRWWSRSNTFDPIILERIAESTGRSSHFEEYIKFWAVRDVRTWIDAKFDFKTPNGFCPIRDESLWNRTFKQHDCRWDVLADVLRFQTIVRAENDLELL